MLLVAVSTRFQEFYKQGEREKLLAEISELRNQVLGDSFFGFLLSYSTTKIISILQLLETLQGNYGMHKFVYGTEQVWNAISGQYHKLVLNICYLLISYHQKIAG